MAQENAREAQDDNPEVEQSINSLPPSGAECERAVAPIPGNQPGEKAVLAMVRKLLEFGDLEPDWDSYGAQPIALKAVQNAEALFSQIAARFFSTTGEEIRPFDVAPLATGGVQFEWRSSTGALEVEIHSDQRYGYLLTLGKGESRKFEESDDATASDILALFSRIIG